MARSNVAAGIVRHSTSEPSLPRLCISCVAVAAPSSTPARSAAPLRAEAHEPALSSAQSAVACAVASAPGAQLESSGKKGDSLLACAEPVRRGARGGGAQCTAQRTPGPRGFEPHARTQARHARTDARPVRPGSADDKQQHHESEDHELDRPGEALPVGQSDATPLTGRVAHERGHHVLLFEGGELDLCAWGRPFDSLQLCLRSGHRSGYDTVDLLQVRLGRCGTSQRWRRSVCHGGVCGCYHR